MPLSTLNSNQQLVRFPFCFLPLPTSRFMLSIPDSSLTLFWCVRLPARHPKHPSLQGPSITSGLPIHAISPGDLAFVGFPRRAARDIFSSGALPICHPLLFKPQIIVVCMLCTQVGIVLPSCGQKLLILQREDIQFIV